MPEQVPTPLIAEIYQAFAGFEKPHRYIVDDLYEPERLDYEDMLGDKTREAIEADDLGHVAWSPLYHLSPKAVAYLLPRLIELAENGSRDRLGEPILSRLIGYVSDGPSSAHFSLLGREQRSVIARYLRHVAAEHSQQAQDECWEDSLADAIREWPTV
ncbi:DUF6714 family protein [Roseateles amylovorans]|uniref:Uncharacterized protein n=1 Tax=Roseateles amylovorans TaxID=2978473 RepID=A0ABY6AUL3_9BURK|nr:DUF6714 family protein [Roseateles amylovorans]UXH76707.1 hypothetical protein N4261_16890 [Roseateles amylovorans]